jgi:hypothetical protein
MNNELQYLTTHGKLCKSISVDEDGVVLYEFCDGTFSEHRPLHVDLSDYRSRSVWEERSDRCLIYIVPFKETHRFDDLTTEKLGLVWPHKGWHWVRRLSRYQSNWKAGEGSVLTRDEAILQVEGGWS